MRTDLPEHPEISSELCEELEALEEAFGLGSLHGETFNTRIRRQRGGRFADLPRAPIDASKLRQKRISQPRLKAVDTEAPVQTSKQPIKILKGKRGVVKRKQFKVFATPHAAAPGHQGDQPERMSSAQFHEEKTSRSQLDELGGRRLMHLADRSRRAGVKAARKGDHEKAALHQAETHAYEKAGTDPVQRIKHGAAAAYEKRTKKLEKRIKRNVAPRRI